MRRGMVQITFLLKEKKLRKHIDKVLGILIIMCIIPALAFADATTDSEIPYKFGQPKFLGNGCPDAGSIAFASSPDNSELSVLFENFTVSTGPTKPFDLSRCKIEVPIDVSEGIMVSVLRVDHRGIADIPEGGKGIFSRKYSIANKKDHRFSRPIFSLPIKKEDEIYELFYEIFHEDSPEVVAMSKCGKDIVARADATLMVKKTTSDNGKAIMSLFSEDWHLEWIKCEDNE